VRDLRRTRKQDAKMLPVAIAGGAKAAQDQANQEANQTAQALPSPVPTTPLTVDAEDISAETDPSS
jgi:hypothetical protein